jgi:hypothetical protein
MLDLVKLARQMQGMSQHLSQESAAARKRLEIATSTLQQASVFQDHLVQQWEEGRDRLGFTVAIPVEPLDGRWAIASAPKHHTVFATDGSQIAPSHHEIAYCYLINVGRVALHYGVQHYPLLDSVPEVFYRSEDLYISRQWGIRTEEWMGLQRTVSEAVTLADLGQQLHQETLSRTYPRPLDIDGWGRSPLVAMVDGSLIHWGMEPLPNEARDRLLTPILEAWARLREAKIPLIGYISSPRSGEALNFLRLQTCPYEYSNCQSQCAGQTEQAPCQVFAPLKDSVLWASILQPGQRSTIWRSSAPILEQYGDHAIHFCYVNVGSEIARIEFPAWVANDRPLLDMALSLTITQVEKGYGYPVALAEAHNQAVVRGGDRRRFFALLEQQMIRAGLTNIGTSYKEARKRGSIA